MESDGRYEDFFAEHKSFFDDETKKALFLEGVLVQKLLNILKKRKRYLVSGESLKSR